MRRLSEEHKRIEELQNVVRPQGRSTPRSKQASPEEQRQPPSKPAQSHIEPQYNETITDPTLRLSDLDKSSLDDSSIFMTDIPVISSSTERKFTEPSALSMSQSTDEPFMLHKSQNAETQPGSAKTTADKRKSQSNATGVSSPKSTPRQQPLTRTNSNGFLSSSQLSRKKASGEVRRITNLKLSSLGRQLL